MSRMTMLQEENRQFIRHPSDIPIEYRVTNKPFKHCDHIADISIGGLSFHATNYIPPEQWIHLHIPINEDHFEIDAQVRWCQLSEDKQNYDVGVLFANKDEAFSARMVEQICYIEQYKKDILKTEGRELTGDQAAVEWIEKFANSFPK